jgi:hypothetical protein
MPNIPSEKKGAEKGRNEAADAQRASAECRRIADIASQLSQEDLNQLRQYIDRHHPKLFQ